MSQIYYETHTYETMIQIKSYFNGWVQSDKQTALNYAKQLFKSITTYKTEKELISYINNHKLKNITFTLYELRQSKKV